MRRAFLLAVLAVAACESTLTPDLDGDALRPFPVDFPSASPPGDFGDGLEGNLTVTTTLNPTICVRSQLVAGSNLTVNAGSPVRSGRRGLLIQIGDERPALTSTGATTDTLAEETLAGNWEIVTVVSTGATSARVSEPPSGFDPNGALMLCSVPQFANVTIASSGRLAPTSRFGGASGGVVAFMVAGTLTIAGEIDASTDGFASGSSSTVPATEVSFGGTDTANNDLAGDKGDGIRTRAPGASSGRGAGTNGGGGGNANRAGGGGGANAGRGGKGGRTYISASNSANSELGGNGGGALFPLADRLTLGGGGGGGHQDVAGNNSRGGLGGGIILVFASNLTGTGLVDASAERGLNSTTADPNQVNGAGGGGGGGTIRIHSGASSYSGKISARGGDGGAPSPMGAAGQTGPGGGGGGGRVRLIGGISGAEADVSGGAAGLFDGTVDHGAVAGDPGTIVRE